MKKGLRTLFPVLLCAVTLLTGCGRHSGNSAPGNHPEQTNQTFSVEIEDVTRTTASEEVQTTAAPETTTAKQTAAQTETAPPPPETTAAPPETTVTEPETTQPPAIQQLDPDGSYNSKEDVALYIHTYGKLPSNYITKKDAQKLGWTGGSLEQYAPGKSIGGSYFGNYEERLPVKNGRSYTECDIDTAGKTSRGAKRIVFSNDGLIYYTEDHYSTFELLYGEE